MGIADVDTRAITRRLRQDGCLNGVITTDASLSDEELIAKTRVRSTRRLDVGLHPSLASNRVSSSRIRCSLLQYCSGV